MVILDNTQHTYIYNHTTQKDHSVAVSIYVFETSCVYSLQIHKYTIITKTAIYSSIMFVLLKAPTRRSDDVS